jgi:hypothetical protein
VKERITALAAIGLFAFIVALNSDIQRVLAGVGIPIVLMLGVLACLAFFVVLLRPRVSQDRKHG